MNTMFKEWLRMAYENENPTKFLYQFLSKQLKQPLTVGSINCVLGELHVSPSPISQITDDTNPMKGVLADVDTFRKTLEVRKLSNQNLIGSFCYFATCMIHVFLNADDSLIVEQPILSYVYPNQPLPYVWLNITSKVDTRVEMVKHRLRDEHNPLRIIMHVVDVPGSLVSHKLSIDLVTGDIMSALHGDFMQIAVITYDRRAHLQGVCKSMNCVLVLTYEGILHGIYYNDPKLNFGHACIYSAHYI